MALLILFFFLWLATAIYGPRIYDSARIAIMRRQNKVSGEKTLRRIREKYRSVRL